MTTSMLVTTCLASARSVSGLEALSAGLAGSGSPGAEWSTESPATNWAKNVRGGRALKNTSLTSHPEIESSSSSCVDCVSKMPLPEAEGISST